MAKPRVGILPYKMVEKASKDLPWDAAFSLVYLWTCPHRKLGGLFHLPLGYMASDLDVSIEEAKEKIELLEGKGYIAYESSVVYFGVAPVYWTLSNLVFKLLLTFRVRLTTSAQTHLDSGTQASNVALLYATYLNVFEDGVFKLSSPWPTIPARAI